MAAPPGCCQSVALGVAVDGVEQTRVEADDDLEPAPGADEGLLAVRRRRLGLG